MADNLLSEVVEVLSGVHQLLEVNHRIQVPHHEELILTAGDIDSNLVE